MTTRLFKLPLCSWSLEPEWFFSWFLSWSLAADCDRPWGSVWGLVCGASAHSWLLPLRRLGAISVLQAEGRASSAAVRMKLIAVVCDQPVQLVVFFASLQPKITLIWSLLRWLSGVTSSSRWRSLVSPLFLCDQTTLLLPPQWSLLFATFKKCQHSGASQEVMSQKRLHVRCFIIVESQQKYKHSDCSFNKKAPTTAGCRAMLLPADPPQAAYTKAFWEYFLFPVLPFSRQQNILSFQK